MTDDEVKAALDEWRAAKTEQQYNAAAVKLLPALVDLIEELEAEVARLRNLMQLHHVLADLASQQMPLGAEFKAALQDRDKLYES